MKKMKIAINGFGRIGRAFYKLAHERDDMEVVAVNDLGDADNLMYLLKYDSAYGIWREADQVKINFIQEKEPTKLPWRNLEVDVVVESTGIFTEYEKARAHIEAGAKRVVITAPGKGVGGETVLMGVNEDKLKDCQISSNASCTTNAVSPVITIMNESVGVEKAILSTTHAYTASQSIVDGPNKKDWREGRSAAMNIVPSSTGAAIAVTKAITDLDKKFDGISLRVPVVTGSIADVTFIAKRATSAEEVNKILADASKEARWTGLLAVSDEPLVSRDIIGRTEASIVDLPMTRVVDGNLVKVLAWYDNEMGYTNTLVEHVSKLGQYI